MIVFLMFALTVLTQVFAQTPGQSEPENPSSKREQEFSNSKREQEIPTQNASRKLSNSKREQEFSNSKREQEILTQN
jgi:hypothetical protein